MISSMAWAEQALGCRLGSAALLEDALTHRSHGSRNNERLEYLGDAVLNFVVAELLYREFDGATEGELSRYRASLVSGETLGDVAAAIGIGEQLRLGEGELKSGGYRRASILADALEAVIGALFLDRGLDEARAAVLRLLGPRLRRLPAAAELRDPKTQLQERMQGKGLELPRYEVIQVSGEPHDRQFEVRCVLDGLGLQAVARGTSRRRAEQEAAALVLEQCEAAGLP